MESNQYYSTGYTQYYNLPQTYYSEPSTTENIPQVGFNKQQDLDFSFADQQLQSYIPIQADFNLKTQYLEQSAITQNLQDSTNYHKIGISQRAEESSLMNDFQPFKQDFNQTLLEYAISTQYYNNYIADISQEKVLREEQSNCGDDQTNEKSRYSNYSSSTLTYDSKLSMIDSKSSLSLGSMCSDRLYALRSNEFQSKLDLCDLFINNQDCISKSQSALGANETLYDNMTYLDDHDEEYQELGFTASQDIYLQSQNGTIVSHEDSFSSTPLLSVTKTEVPKKQAHKISSFNTYGRSDIVFKTILRKIRKQYLTDFNETTGYIKRKRNRKPQFLVELLNQYTEQLLKNQSQALKQEMVFFLGSIFYPKHLKKCFASQTKKKEEIDQIHSSLYKYTVQRLSFLESYGAYNYLLSDFMTNHKDKSLESSKTMEKARTDFILGFNQIQQRLNLKSSSQTSLPKVVTSSTSVQSTASKNCKSRKQ
ncbi:UNKNOWN [Stylonychia lemnae]|uniref:Uncharacterized protein n=1 Tax=Stylonychia lemnae TaxID=5949 RepID=A0A078AFU8_STYLE|nr:UNKNOWN [Stylonychia lemnae]|eukprot:CDW81104.1 UNKNOWN [Stylonychia lemnae]